MKDPIVQMEHVSVAYQNLVALNDINLDIYKGEYIGIFGPNGSGKTTLLKTILGLIKPINGIIKLFGESNSNRSRAKIGYVPQNPSANRSFPATVLDVVEMGLYGKVGFMKPLKEKHAERAAKALHDVHLGHYRNRPIGHLSGGELQKVMVARALVSEPEIILLDEPTSNLDFMMTKDLMEILEELNKKYAITIICIHHHLEILRPYISRLLLINRRIVYDGPPEMEEVDKTINSIFNATIITK